MPNQPFASKKAKASRASSAWPGFAEKLTTVLARLEAGQFLVLSVRHGNRFVQFSTSQAFGLRAETTSNNYLSEPEQIDPGQIAALAALGWHAPTGTPEQATPVNDPHGSPNFFCEWQAPVPFQTVAQVAQRTLVEVLQVAHPRQLEYEAFDAAGKKLALPELGLRGTQRKSGPDDPAALAKKLLTILKKSTGIDDLAFDEDGDIVLQYANAVIFIQLTEAPVYVRFFCPIVRDIDDSPELFERLNDINAHENVLRLVFQGGIIGAVACILAQPLVSAHVVQTCQRFCAAMDGMDHLLQRQFGGESAFAEPPPSVLLH